MNASDKLPEPKGKYRVGFSHLNFIDPTRLVDFPDREGQFRDLPVMIWYPAKNVEGCSSRSYESPEAFQARIETIVSLLPPQMSDQVRGMFQYPQVETNSFIDAPIIDQNDLPTLFFAPGYTSSIWQNQFQFEHLASHGYVIISFGIPQEGVHQYPDGRVEPVSAGMIQAFNQERAAVIQDMMACLGILGDRKNKTVDEIRETTQRLYDPEKNPFITQRMETWYQDFLFIRRKIEELNQSTKESPFHGKLNIKKIGFFGMSMGGGLASFLAYRKEPGVVGTISLDGSHYGIPYDARIEIPHLILQSNESSRLVFEMMERDAYYITVADTSHYNFTDYTYINRDAYKGLGFIKGIEPELMTQIMNNSILAFFDKYLLGKSISIPESLSHLTGIEIEEKQAL